jgi:hypothetical protein
MRRYRDLFHWARSLGSAPGKHFCSEMMRYPIQTIEPVDACTLTRESFRPRRAQSSRQAPWLTFAFTCSSA